MFKKSTNPPTNKSPRRALLWVVAAIGIFIVVAGGTIAALTITHQGKETTETVSDDSLRQTAESTKAKAEASVKDGKNEEALSLYKQALTEYEKADASSTEFTADAPRPEVIDIKSQISYLENVPKVEQQTAPPQMAR